MIIIEEISEEEKEKRWKEMVSRSRVDVKKKRELVVDVGVGRSYLSDLWLLVILLVVWISFFGIVEIGGLC